VQAIVELLTMLLGTECM